MGAGRPTKLTPGIQAAIVKGVAAGLPYDTACTLAGIDVSTALRWLRCGEGRLFAQRPTPKFIQFCQEVKRAQSQAEAGRIALIMNAARGGAVIARKTTKAAQQLVDGHVIDGQVVIEEKLQSPQWVAAAWLLERMMPEKFARHERVDVTVIRSEAEKLAEEYGLEKRELDELVAEAEAIAAGRE